MKSLFNISIGTVIIKAEECCVVKEKITGYILDLKIFEGKNVTPLFTIKGKLNIMALSMTDTQKASGVLKFVDSKGAPTDVPDGNVVITSSNEEAATVTYDDPSNTVTVTAGLPGVAALHFDVKDANGNSLPFDDVAVEITSGNAVSGTIEFGAPTEQ